MRVREEDEVGMTMEDFNDDRGADRGILKPRVRTDIMVRRSDTRESIGEGRRRKESDRMILTITVASFLQKVSQCFFKRRCFYLKSTPAIL